MARRRKPTQLKVLRSDPKLKYEKRTEAVPTADNLAAPAHLAGVALEKWNELRQILEPVGLLTEADKDQLAQYCINWELYLVCIDQIRKGGMVNEYEGKVGMNYKQSDPYVVNMYKLHAAMMKTATQFGLTPSARASIDVGKSTEADPLKEFLG